MIESVRTHISKTTRPNFNKFSVRVFCGSARSSSIAALQHVSGFVDDVNVSLYSGRAVVV